ncbi:MAG: peroxidase [Chloroflexota bacterium]
MPAGEADAFVHAIAKDWRTTPLSKQDKALCQFAAKLTLTPSQMCSDDLEILRSHGLDDRAIHDTTQVIAYFNYINRIADALGVEPEDFIQRWGA